MPIILITKKIQDWFVILKLKWELDENNLYILKKHFKEVLADGSCTKLILNINSLNYMNSVVVWYLAWELTKFKKNNKKFVFTAPNEHILEIIELVWLSLAVNVFESDEEAMLYYTNN